MNDDFKWATTIVYGILALVTLIIGAEYTTREQTIDCQQAVLRTGKTAEDAALLCGEVSK